MVKLGYDKDGHITSKLDEDGLETLYEYNLVGKLTKVSYADGKTAEYAYNPLRQLTAMHDWLGTTKIEVDALGRATRVKDHEGKEVGYEWDALGRKEKLIYPDGSEVKYEYTPSGWLDRVRSSDGITRYYYDAMGRVTERVLPDSTNTKYELNPLGRLTSLIHSKDGDILDQFKYTYDPAGNIARIEKQRVGLEADSGLFEYSYDDVGRLIAAVRGDQVKRYRYDELGNRVREWKGHKYDEVNWTQHSYNKRNQLIKTTEGDAVRDYRYDGRGNLTHITENGQLKSRFDFDATNMMVGAFTEGKGTAEYAYNGFRNRVKKLETLQNPRMAHGLPADPVSEIRYTLDMTLPYNNLLATNGTQKQSFVWGSGLISANGEDKFYYLQDHLGSPIRLVGGEENDTALTYDEFGVPLVGTGKNINQPFGFTGYQGDDVSGLYYAQARYYDSRVGRFDAEDPIRHMLNWYAYCNCNPIAWIDPTGFDGEYSLSIYSSPDTGLTGGHSFVVVENNSNEAIIVGAYSLDAGSSVSIGTWGNQEGNSGIWYNLEALNPNAFMDDVSMTMNFDKEQLSKINQFIDKNDEWTLYRNCSWFASGLWNDISDNKLSALNWFAWNTPESLAYSIQNEECSVTGRSFSQANEAGYKDGKGVYYTPPTNSSVHLSNSRSSSNSSSGSSGASSSGSSGPSSSSFGYRSSSAGSSR
jgi:RHS repeat-associated protein